MRKNFYLWEGVKAHRFGFNDKENDRNGSWSGTQLVQDYGARLYNPAIARFLSVDPIDDQYPELTPYQFASNTPIQAIDLDGLEASYGGPYANPQQMLSTAFSDMSRALYSTLDRVSLFFKNTADIISYERKDKVAASTVTTTAGVYIENTKRYGGGFTQLFDYVKSNNTAKGAPSTLYESKTETKSFTKSETEFTIKTPAGNATAKTSVKTLVSEKGVISVESKFEIKSPKPVRGVDGTSVSRTEGSDGKVKYTVDASRSLPNNQKLSIPIEYEKKGSDKKINIGVKYEKKSDDKKVTVTTQAGVSVKLK